jgi:hypothetical protein
MRALGFLLLLLLPLSAGEIDDLARAVAKFDSDHAGEREAASQTVRRHLQAALAPLLAALKSDDPEVSRRAREAIASLLPERKAEPEASGNVGGNVIIGFGGRANQRFRFVVQQGKRGNVVFVQGGNEKENAALKKYGLEGYAVDDVLLRRQLRLAAGRGFAVNKVLRDTAAARLGLKTHDIILSVGGKPVQRADRLLKALGKEETWKGLEMVVLRDGKVVGLGARSERD